MVALLDATDTDRAVLVGYSIGGYLSLRFALDHPDRVRALVLEGAGPGFKNAEAEKEWNEGVVGRWARTIEDKGIEAFAAEVPEVARVTHTSAKGLAMAVRGFGCRSGDRVIRSLGEIAVPTLCIAGENDTLMGQASSYLAKKIPNAENAVVAGAGHGAHMDDPAAFLAALEPFLRDHGG
jgi:pimeloyl-ACP methyl ester carboxylesterase